MKLKGNVMRNPPDLSGAGSEPSSSVKILAIGGGKGGVGKTVLTASLGTGLALLNHRVIIADGDLGGSDLHTAMGIHKPEKTFMDFYNHNVDSLREVLIEYPIVEGLRILCGAVGTYGIANLAYTHKKRFIRQLRTLDADYVLLDLGAGSSYNVLDFFLAADQGIIVVNPDPLSILEAYNFLKQTLFRRLAQMIRHHEGGLEIVREVASREIHRESATVEDLVQGVKAQDPQMGRRMERFISLFRPTFLINFFHRREDVDQILSIQTASADLLSVSVDILGCVHKDELVPAALREGKPFILVDPKAQASKDISEIVLRIRETGRFQALRGRSAIRKKGKRSKDLKWPDSEVICSVRCQYWEDCGFRDGGKPCSLRHLRSIHGMQRE